MHLFVEDVESARETCTISLDVLRIDLESLKSGLSFAEKELTTELSNPSRGVLSRTPKSVFQKQTKMQSLPPVTNRHVDGRTALMNALISRRASVSGLDDEDEEEESKAKEGSEVILSLEDSSLETEDIESDETQIVHFADLLSSQLSCIRQRVLEANREVSKVEEITVQMARHFGEDEQNARPDAMMTVLRDFTDSFLEARKKAVRRNQSYSTKQREISG